jgi:hypothetical protein
VIVPQQTPGKAPILGVNFRIDLLKAVRATWETAKVVVKAKVAAAVPFDPVTWFGIGIEALSAVRSIVSSLVETMRPIDYVTYLILSTKPDGMTETELEEGVLNFLKNPQSVDFAWYLGMSGDRLSRAEEVTQQQGWLSTVLNNLQQKDMLERHGAMLAFKSRHFTVGWKEV